MRAKHLIAVVFALLPGSGCLARQLERDGNNFRESVCDLYTEQAIDNLIRAKTNQPFVHLVYRDLLAQTTDFTDGSLGANAGLDRQTGPVGGIMRAVSSGFTANANANRQRQLSFHADPVLDRPDVYEAFIRFAGDPGLLVESDAPPRCPVHLHRKRGKKHYWVPCEAGPAFLALVVLTSFSPPGEPPISPAYDVEVERVVADEAVGRGDLRNVTLKFKEPVPNGEGTLTLAVGDRQLRLVAFPILGKGNVEGVSTDQLIVQIDAKRLGIETGQLQGLKGQLYSYRFPKLVPTPASPASQRLYNELDRIRARTR